MKNLKFKIISFTIFCFFWGISFAQSQETLKGMHWNGTNLETIEAKVSDDKLELKELYYKATTNADKVKIQLKAKEGEPDNYIAKNSVTGETFEVSYLMSIYFKHPNAEEKEFLPIMKYMNGDEKILMGSMPFLGNIIYQKGNSSPELWLKDAGFECKAGERNGNRSFLCEFATAKGENLRLMIDQVGKQVTLWRNGEMISFREKK